MVKYDRKRDSIYFIDYEFPKYKSNFAQVQNHKRLSKHRFKRDLAQQGKSCGEHRQKAALKYIND